MMKKKGDVWVSAVLYIALGMIIITLILSAGLPLIEKMRDKNTIVQTKRMLFNLNSNIEAVANEGVGSQRYISPFEITSGSLTFDFGKNLIIWKMTTKSLMMEPSNLTVLIQDCIEENEMNSKECTDLTTFKEGALTMWMIETPVEGEYDLYAELKYCDPECSINLETTDLRQVIPLAGKYNLAVKNKGPEPVTNIPIISIEIT